MCFSLKEQLQSLVGFCFISPLTDSLGLLHGVSCSQDVLGVKGHHGLHLQDGGVGQGVVHAVFDSGKNKKRMNSSASAAGEKRTHRQGFCPSVHLSTGTADRWNRKLKPHSGWLSMCRVTRRFKDTALGCCDGGVQGFDVTSRHTGCSS